MIALSNGRSISTICISTALGIDGMGIFPRTISRDYMDLVSTVHSTDTTIFGKSTTRHKWIGNFRSWNPFTWKYIQNLGSNGMLNAYGLTNKGVEVHSRDIARAASIGVQIIPSYFPKFDRGINIAIGEVLEAVDIYEEHMGDNFWAMEANWSCPNSPECIRDIIHGAVKCSEAIKEYRPRLTLIGKISVVQPISFALDLKLAGTDIIHSANTVPWALLFQNKSPLDEVGGGGVSGGPAFEEVFKFNSKLIKYYEGPIIIGCGIIDDEKLERYIRLMSGWESFFGHSGNSVSYSLCTAALRRPTWVKQQIQNYNEQ